MVQPAFPHPDFNPLSITRSILSPRYPSILIELGEQENILSETELTGSDFVPGF